MSTKILTPLIIFRVIGDRRVPYLIELDEEMTIVTDSPIDSTGESTGFKTPELTPEILEKYPDLGNPIFTAGITHEVILENGGRSVSLKPTALDIKVGMWTTPSVIENPILGTDDLRAEFFEVERQMRDKHASEGTECAPCDLGTIIRRYRLKLFNDGYLDDVLPEMQGRA